MKMINPDQASMIARIGLLRKNAMPLLIEPRLVLFQEMGENNWQPQKYEIAFRLIGKFAGKNPRGVIVFVTLKGIISGFKMLHNKELKRYLKEKDDREIDANYKVMMREQNERTRT